jgi:hypothetical protein
MATSVVGSMAEGRPQVFAGRVVAAPLEQDLALARLGFLGHGRRQLAEMGQAAKKGQRLLPLPRFLKPPGARKHLVE